MPDTAAPAPALLRTVLYTLTERDAKEIAQRRSERQTLDYPPVFAGEQYSMLITALWQEPATLATPVTGQVDPFDDDAFWVQSVTCGEGRGKYQWPTRS